MWNICFPQDSMRFIRFYFDKIYANNETLVYIENGQPVASLQMIPFQIKTGYTIHKAGYISGAMTHPDYRKKGIMAQLLTASFEFMRVKGYNYTFLIPQEEYLVDYYKKFGYINAFPEYFTSWRCPAEIKIRRNIKIYTSFRVSIFPVLYPIYSHYMSKKANVVLKSEMQFFKTVYDFFDGKGVLFANSAGFAFSSVEGKSIILSDFFYKNEETKTEFLQTIGAYYSTKEEIIYNAPAFPMTGYKGMIKPLNNFINTKTDIYMGRMFE